MNHRCRISFYVLMLMTFVSVTSCSTRKHTIRGHRAELLSKEQTRNHKPHHLETTKGKDVVSKILAEGQSWIGTPYLYGGQNRSGVDCSGLVQAVFDRAAGIKLPHNSRDQAMQSRKVSRRELRPADLVFFVSKPGGNRINHVAIYIGDGRIVHSTTSRGVIESNLDEGYWKSHFYCCGRVL